MASKHLFQKCWETLAENLWEVIEETRIAGSLLTEIKNTLLALNPKKDNHKELSDFRPIALCNTLYKILSKTLANRLKTVLPKLTSKEQ